LDDQARRAISNHRRPWLYSPRPTKRIQSRAIHSHGERESCVWQQGPILSWRQQNRIELYALLNQRPKQLIIKKLRSSYCTIEANYWQTRSIAQPLCDSGATCFVVLVTNKDIHTDDQKQYFVIPGRVPVITKNTKSCQKRVRQNSKESETG